MSYPKSWQLLIILILAALVLTTCGVITPVPSGQVRGILFEKDLSSPVDVALAYIDKTYGAVVVDFTLISTPNDSGDFIIENVPPGRYFLALCYKQSTDTGEMIITEIGLVFKEGKIFTFEMPQDSGIDLGRIDTSQIYILEH